MVTHNLEHLWQVCNRVVVMRRGRKVANMASCETTMEEVVAYITGAKEPPPVRSLGAEPGSSGESDRPERPCPSLLADAPRNWGKWGADDEVGALNYLTGEEIGLGVASIRRRRPFTLGAPVATAAGDPVFPGRWAARHYMVADKAGFEAGHWRPLPGGLEFADDYVSGFAQAGTHCDALGHMWFDDTLWNGFPAASTNGGMTKAGIEPIARRGIVGRAVLLDLARFRGEAFLKRAETFDHRDLLECARSQEVEIEPRSILMLRTGWLGALIRGEVGNRRQVLGAWPDLQSRTRALVSRDADPLLSHRHARERDDIRAE